MPKTAIDVDGNTSRPENNVRTGAQARHQSTIDAKAKSPSVELRAQSQLRLRIATAEP
jgi:hypothetical protein